jgi:hypothetical protein
LAAGRVQAKADPAVTYLQVACGFLPVRSHAVAYQLLCRSWSWPKERLAL